MQFPVYIEFLGIRLHPHMVMEGLAYAAGLAMHLFIKSRNRLMNTSARAQRSLWQIAGAIVGALAGAKLLAWAENFQSLLHQSPSVEGWLGGKTIVGGLIGGWIGIEVAKRLTGTRARTGDLWVYPLIVSIAIGRVGCFLTGLADQTHGNLTALPWAVDFGDGPRHPTQLYEIAALLLIGLTLFLYQWRAHLGFATGRLFRCFMIAYCGWRFLVEFIKPSPKPLAGLSAIQIACALTCIFAAWSLARSPKVPVQELHPAETAPPA